LNGQWTEPDIRDDVIDSIRYLARRTSISENKLVGWLNITRSKFNSWKERYGKVNEHNKLVPRDFWLEPWEKDLIETFFYKHQDQGYRRLTYMMMDEDVVYVSPSTVYRVLKNKGLLRRWAHKKSTKGNGFVQPLKAHAHWHNDITYVNINGTFYYLSIVLDGFSRYVVHWEIREAMKEKDVEIILQRAREKFPDASPRIISDNGPQYISKDFKSFIKESGMTHVRTSPYYPQSNGKIERFNKTIKKECIRPKTPLTLDDARRAITDYIDEYNNKRLHSSNGYITPKDKLNGKADEIKNHREQKLHEAREARKLKRAA